MAAYIVAPCHSAMHLSRFVLVVLCTNMAQAYVEVTLTEQAKAVNPAQLYPALGIGSLPGSAELVLCARLYQTKKEVHRIPYRAPRLSGFRVWGPLFLSRLLDTSVAALKR